MTKQWKAGVAGAALASFAMYSMVSAEVTWWEVNGDGGGWSSPDLNRSSTAIDFGFERAIQIAGFQPGDNIVGSLAWEDGFPQGGFAVERPRAHIWNNYPLKSTDIPMVDGDPETSTEDRFKVFGASQTGRQFYLDLGSRFPLNRMTFFPRLTGLSPTGDPLSDDFIRGYEVHFNDGLLLGEDGRPIYNLLKRVDLTRDSVAVVEFPLQFVRHLRLEVIQPNPFEIAEIQLFGAGFVPRAEYLSNVIDLGRPVNFGRLGWNATRLRLLNGEIIFEDGAAASAFLQMKSGSDDSPLIHYQITNKFFGETAEVSESDYSSLAPDDRGGIEDDQINWSPWSEPFTGSGQLIALPSPRQFFQFRVVMESESILDGIRLDSLAVEISSPPLANSLIGEISLLDEPQPEGRFAVVPAGETATFAYDIHADVSGEAIGFDALMIFTPSTAVFREFLMGEDDLSLAQVIPEKVTSTRDVLTLEFPGNRVTSEASMRVVFDAQVLIQATSFDSEAFDTQSEELTQPVLPSNATDLVNTDKLQVLTSAETRRDVLSSLEIAPRVLTPNGDAINDAADIDFQILQVLEEVPIRIEVFDLSGRRVRTLVDTRFGRGVYGETWDGTDSSGKVVPVGLYIIRVAVESIVEDFSEAVAVGVVY